MRLSVEDVVYQLGPGNVTLLGVFGADREVACVEYWDLSDEIPMLQGALLLVPSFEAIEHDRLVALIKNAHELGIAGLGVKCGEHRVSELSKLANDTQFPIMRVSARVGWRYIDGQLSRLFSEGTPVGGNPQYRRAEPILVLVNELAEYFGGSVVIEDLGRNVLVYSSVPGQKIDALRTRGILARKVPDVPRNEDQYRTVLRADGAVKFPSFEDEADRVAIAIRSGHMPLGTIWAIDTSGHDEITEAQAERMTNAATNASVHLLEDLRTGDQDDRPREDRLRRLLSGIDVTGAEFAELGIREERGAVLVEFDGKGLSPSSLSHLRATVLRQLRVHRPESVAVVHLGSVFLLVGDDDSDAVAEQVESLIPLLDRLVAPGVRAAVSASVRHPSEINGSRELLDQLLLTASRTERFAATRVISVFMLRGQLAIDRATESYAHSPELSDPALATLGASDSGRVILETLLVWLESFGNSARTAEILHVHQNTVRYRLHNATHVHGVQLEPADARLAAWLQLRSILRRPGGR